jgi:glycosyltransferase involved in cell wall biosynthesis
MRVVFMNSDPTVSVLMPVYNTPSGVLARSIESILSQTFQDFELLILNDSPENPEVENIVRSFGDARIDYKKNAVNIGISASRNRLLSESLGKYIAVMDHDDISLPLRLEKQVRFLDTNPEIGVVSSNAYFFNQDKTLVYPSGDFDIKMDLISGICSILHPASMMRKNILMENNLIYEEDFTPAEDFRLWHRMMSITKFANIQDTLFLYRDDDRNASKKMSMKMKLATARIMEESAKDNRRMFEDYERLELRYFWLRALKSAGIISIETVEDKLRIMLLGKKHVGSIRKHHVSFRFVKGRC